MIAWKQTLLQQLATVRGVQAVGALEPDGRVFAPVPSAAFPVASLGVLLRALADLFHVLTLHRRQPERLRWLFSAGAVHGVHHANAGVIAAVVDHRPARLDAVALERLLAEAARGLRAAA